MVVGSIGYWFFVYKGCEVSGGGIGTKMCIARKANGHRLGFYNSVAEAKDAIDLFRK